MVDKSKSRAHYKGDSKDPRAEGSRVDTILMCQVESLELQPITSVEELPLAVHGTSTEAWQSICEPLYILITCCPF